MLRCDVMLRCATNWFMALTSLCSPMKWWPRFARLAQKHGWHCFARLARTRQSTGGAASLGLRQDMHFPPRSVDANALGFASLAHVAHSKG